MLSFSILAIIYVVENLVEDTTQSESPFLSLNRLVNIFVEADKALDEEREYCVLETHSLKNK